MHDYKVQWWIVIILNVINLCLVLFNGRVDLCKLNFGNPVLYIISSILGSIGILLLCKKFDSFKCKPMLYIGANSLIVQCTHMKLIELFSRLNCPDIIIAVLVLLLEFPIIYVCNKYLYFVIGRKSKLNISGNL